MAMHHTIDELSERLYRVEASVEELREEITEERIVSARIGAQVAAHESRGQERHSEVLAAIAALRDDHRAMMTAQIERERQRLEVLGRVALSVVGVIGTVAAGYYGIAR